MNDEPAPIYLLSAKGDDCPAELHFGIKPEHLSDWLYKWQPFLEEKLKNIPAALRPQHPHWNWLKKQMVYGGQIAMSSYAITCNGETQGLMWVNKTKYSQMEAAKGKPLVYIEFLSSAPWNDRRLQSPVCYKGVGSIMVKAAINLSVDEEFKGRIGLHSLPQAEPFYNKMGLCDLGIDHSHQSLRYYEMTEEQAGLILDS